MKSVVVFSGKSGVDFSEVRTSVLRIPEVSLKVKQAQKTIDRLGLNHDLVAIMNSDDAVFARNEAIKTIVAAVVQVALFERTLRLHKKPNYLIASTADLSALDVVTGKMTIDSLIEAALIAEVTNESVAKVLPLRSENAELEYALVEANILENGQIRGFTDAVKTSDLQKLFRDMIEKMNVTKFVNIGPCNALATSKDETLESATVIDSIEADPILNWFWQSLRPAFQIYAT